MYKPLSPYTLIAFETIGYALHHSNLKKFNAPKVPESLFTEQRGCFVSLHMQDDHLRGCIGTIEPREKNLVEEIKRNAISAAFHDHRFSPLTPEEYVRISLSVDVLSVPELINSADDLDPQIFGLIISDGKFKRGVLLPSIPGIETVEKQVEITKRKAGLEHTEDGKLLFYRFSSTRYH